MNDNVLDAANDNLVEAEEDTSALVDELSNVIYLYVLVDWIQTLRTWDCRETYVFTAANDNVDG